MQPPPLRRSYARSRSASRNVAPPGGSRRTSTSRCGRTTSASSPRQSSIGASSCSPRIHRPDGDNRMRRPNDFGGRVQGDAYFTDSIGIKRSKTARVDRRGVGCVISAGARRFEAGHVGEIAKLTRRLESGDEIGKLIAVSRQDRRCAAASWRRRYAPSRQRTLRRRFSQPPENAPAAFRSGPRPHCCGGWQSAAPASAAFGGDAAAGRAADGSSNARATEASKDPGALALMPPTRATLRSGYSRRRVASSRSVGQSGMSLSHSISVAIGPARAMTCS